MAGTRDRAPVAMTIFREMISLFHVGKALCLNQSLHQIAAGLIHHAVHAAHDFFEVNLVQLSMNANISGILNAADDIRRIDQHLGGNAAVVQAGASGWSLVHQSHPKALLRCP